MYPNGGSETYITREFAAIGNNLNQIAAFFNSGGIQSRAMHENINHAISCISAFCRGKIGIEFYDEDHSYDEDRYNTIGDTSAGRISQKAEGALIGNIDQFIGKVNEILFVVYTERVRIEESGTKTDVTRLISARMATEFERGLYYGKNE